MSYGVWRVTYNSGKDVTNEVFVAKDLADLGRQWREYFGDTPNDPYNDPDKVELIAHEDADGDGQCAGFSYERPEP